MTTVSPRLGAACAGAHADRTRTADQPIDRDQVDSIVHTAMRLDSQGRSLMGDDTIRDIARELNVDSTLVCRALDDHRAKHTREAIPPLLPPPWQSVPLVPAAAQLDPATRRACADAIDRLPRLPTHGTRAAPPSRRLQPCASRPRPDWSH
ncbi:MAG: hypothetical protein WCO90_03410 [Planctomycetota bacterium]